MQGHFAAWLVPDGLQNVDSSVNLLVAIRELSEKKSSIMSPWNLEIELAVPTLPEWLLQLIPSGGELIRLSEEDYLRMDAFLDSNPRRYMVIPGSPSAAAAENFNRILLQLIPLREYNRKLRENAPAAQAPAPILSPTTIEEAVSLGYVDCKVILTAMHFEFASQSALTKYLNEHDSIRGFKPGPMRRMVHAADFLRTFYEERVAEQKGLAKSRGDKPDRRNKTGK
jgi:hypothetical protein